jgi:peptidoglycan/LPS O-acetylase OafA/YrhL
VTRQRLARVFWLGAAAILVVAALISLVAILGGGFSETDGRILATLGSLLYTGAAALAGLALAEREKARPLGLALLGLSAVTFVLLAAAIWGADGDTAWRIALSGALYLVAGLVATTGLLLTTRPALQRLSLVAGALTVVAVSLTSSRSGKTTSAAPSGR